MAQLAKRSSRLARFAWFVVIYLVAVILWGAWVRISGSGAGCGSHWPLCNGAFTPNSPTQQALIEYSHRLTSGISIVLVGALFWWAVRAFPRRHGVRRAAGASVIIMLCEALLGAGLVLFGLVEQDRSSMRAVAVAVHLANTMALLGATTLTAWLAGSDRSVRWAGPWRWLMPIALAGIILSSMSGAVTALGDTLFPTQPGQWGEKLGAHAVAGTHFLIRLRMLHPLVAVITACLIVPLAAAAGSSSRGGRVKRVSRLALAVTVTQLGAGTLNVLFAAPAWLQVLHLLLADALWISLVVLQMELLVRRDDEHHGEARLAA